METSDSDHRLQTAGLAWLCGYLLLIAAVVWLVFHARDRALESLDTPAARAEWERWRAEVARQSVEGPVRRHLQASPEPPTLVLLRDHFGVMLGAALVFSSLLFATVMIIVRGVLKPKSPTIKPVQQQPAQNEPARK